MAEHFRLWVQAGHLIEAPAKSNVQLGHKMLRCTGCPIMAGAYTQTSKFSLVSM